MVISHGFGYKLLEKTQIGGSQRILVLGLFQPGQTVTVHQAKTTELIKS